MLGAIMNARKLRVEIRPPWWLGLWGFIFLVHWAALDGHAQNCTLVCQQNLVIKADPTCSVTITYDMILDGEENAGLCSPNGPGDFKVDVALTATGPAIPTSPQVTRDYLGRTLYARVTHIPSGNFCTGSFSVQNLGLPVINCPPAVDIRCGDSTEPSNTGMATSNDCGTYNITYKDVYENLVMMCGPLVGRITRTWKITSGTGSTNSCEQTINILRPNINDVVFPPHRNDIAAPALSCISPNTSPDSTGYPTIYGQPIGMNGLCGLSVSMRDARISGCGNTYSIIRTWSLVEACGSTIRRFDQVIQIKDKIGPVLVCPDTIRAVTTDLVGCKANVTIPAISITETCSTPVEVMVMSDFGVIRANGGMLTGVPLGDHQIMYIVTDACGNTSRCTATIKVIDKTPPNLLCDSKVQVALTTGGIGVADIDAFDVVAEDNCCPVTLDVRRMEETDLAYGPQVQFTCADINKDVRAIVRATDCFGNSNFCMVQVQVVDKQPVTITCPPNTNAQCTQDLTNPDITGKPVADGMCDIYTLKFTDQDFPQECGRGYRIRNWLIEYGGASEFTCTQRIDYVDTTTLRAIFPPDYTITNCTSLDDLLAPNLPAQYTNVQLINTACRKVGISFSDAAPTFGGPGNCIEVRRTWVVTDSCAFDPANPGAGGRITHVQRLRVQDNTPPVFTCPTQGSVVFLDPDACSTDLTFPVPDDIQECIPTGVTVRIDGDLGTDFQANAVPAGNYIITYYVTDICGNTATCDVEYAIIENTPPDVECIGTITVPIGNNGTVTVQATAFENGSTDNCTAPGNLQFRLGPRPTPGNASPPNTTSLTFTCDNLGANLRTFWVIDEAGNFSACNVVINVTDAANNCGFGVQLAGNIRMETGQGIPGVGVALSDPGIDPVVTNAGGNYNFATIPVGGNVDVIPVRNDNYALGTSTMDLILLNMHILGTRLLDSPYKIIAADVDGNGRVSIRDLAQLQRLVLGQISVLPENASWRFIPADYVFPNPLDPFTPPFPESSTVSLLMNNLNVDFIGVKVGDLNNSAISGTGTTLRSNPEARGLRLPDLQVAPGDVIRLPLTALGNKPWLGMQASIQVEEGAIQVRQIEPVLATGQWAQSARTDGGWDLSWFTAEPVWLTEETPFAVIELEVLRYGNLSDFLRFDRAPLRAESYIPGSQGEPQPANLHLSWLAPAPAKPLVSGGVLAHPNPFRDEITFQVPRVADEQLLLQVWDTQGRLVLRRSWAPSLEAQTSLTLPASWFPGPGMYLYRWQQGNWVETGRMLRIP
ncbi:MAG: hypothetical protein H6555_07130 [Lewinellaceae bacterium]|nr:hypothetical protein [Lewinellaceae bacterium]